MFGYAFQKGLVPVSLAAIERAIELNGVAVEANRRTFGWGRLAAHDPAKATAAARPLLPDELPSPSHEELIARRATFLTEYQDSAYAARYLALVTAVKEAERVRAAGQMGLTEAVAANFFKLMAYKDEYEVARLFTDGRFMAKLKRQFAGDFKLQFHLAPPLTAARDPNTGQLQKRAFGPWMFGVFRLLARLRRLRGTRFDPFGYTVERRAERALIADYEALTAEIIGRLDPANHALALALASIPEQIRGFGHVKERNLKAAKAREAELLGRFRSPQPAMAAE
jgi:indolepyruvate ferredoxin oxidoreductase